MILVCMCDDLEVGRSLEQAQQFAALGGVGTVQDHGGYVLQIQAQGITEQKQQKQGNGHGHDQTPPVPNDMEEFLAGHGAETGDTNHDPCSRFLSVSSMRETNTSSMVGVIRSRV